MKYTKYIINFITFIVVISFVSGCSKKINCDLCSSSGKVVCTTCGGDKKYTMNIDCRYCNNGYSICGECDGEGTTECRYCDGNGQTFEPCPVCGGSGLDYNTGGYGGPCHVCGGAAMRYEPCFKCNGDGNSECELCGGDGKVHCSYCSGFGYMSKEVNCNICDENGKIQCSKCQGKGYFIE